MSEFSRTVTGWLQAIAAKQREIAHSITSSPSWPPIENTARGLTAPVRALAHGTLRAFPAIRNAEWLLEVERLTRVNPVMLAIALTFVFWRGFQVTPLGHIGTDSLIYPFIGALSYFNPFLAVISAVVFGIGDLLQKLLWNDIYGAQTRGRDMNYWGAMAGYVFAYSALIAMALIPGMLSRVFRLVARRTINSMTARSAGATADGASPAMGGGPAHLVAELGASMLGAAVGGYGTMNYLAGPLESPAFYGPPGVRRPNPDVGCHAAEVNTYLKGRAPTAGTSGPAIVGPGLTLASQPNQIVKPAAPDAPPKKPRRRTPVPMSPLMRGINPGVFGAPDPFDSGETGEEPTEEPPPFDEDGRTTVPGTCRVGHAVPAGSTYCEQCFRDNRDNPEASALDGFKPDTPPEAPPPPPAINERGETTVPGTCRVGHPVPAGSTYCEQCFRDNRDNPEASALDGFTPDDPNVPVGPAQPAQEPTEPITPEEYFSDDGTPPEDQPDDEETPSDEQPPVEQEPPEEKPEQEPGPEPGPEDQADEQETPTPMPDTGISESTDPDPDPYEVVGPPVEDPDAPDSDPSTPWDGGSLEGPAAEQYLKDNGMWDYTTDSPVQRPDGGIPFEGGWVPPEEGQPGRIVVIPPSNYVPPSPTAPDQSASLPQSGTPQGILGRIAPPTVFGAPNPFEQTPSSQPLPGQPELGIFDPPELSGELPEQPPGDDILLPNANPIPDRPPSGEPDKPDEPTEPEESPDAPLPNPGPLGRPRGGPQRED